MSDVTWAEFAALRAKVNQAVDDMTWDGNEDDEPDYDGGGI